MILSAVLLGARIMGGLTGIQVWDDQYGDVMLQLSTSEVEGADAVEVVRGSMWGWPQSRDYARVREDVRGIGTSISSSVRLEIGSQANGEYLFVWLVQQPDMITLYTNLNGAITAEPLGDGHWETCLAVLRESAAWELAAAGDFGVFDGTTYFVSILMPEGHGQFAVYAPVLDSRELEASRHTFSSAYSADHDRPIR